MKCLKNLRRIIRSLNHLQWGVIVLGLIYSLPLFAQDQILEYNLKHREGSGILNIDIKIDHLNSTNTSLVVPRSAPGTYEITNYTRFYKNVIGITVEGDTLPGMLGAGSYYIFREDTFLALIQYEVDVQEMEKELLGAFASSKSRDGYIGILGYSVFGVVEGLEEKPIQLHVRSSANWPVFTTLNPTKKSVGYLSEKVTNYALLADAQYLLGKKVQIHQVDDSPIPLYVAAYSETPIDLSEIGRRAKVSLEGLADYFGYVPMPHYTVCYEFLEPISEKHGYGFSMEHLNSMTASLDTSRAIKDYNPDPPIGSMVHHMGHSWIPLRSYGTGYRPFEWGTAPIIETIWLNEGFIWYVMTKVLEDRKRLNFFRGVTKSAPDYIKRKSLKELSQLGSSQYSLDFDIGRNLFSRGALMAYEMDVEIQRITNGEKSFRDALLGLLKWTDKNQRAFRYDEIEPILSNATSVDLKTIWDKWQRPMKD